ncbi:MAG: TolC family protein [Bacteroidales bacterium]|nr:TolC family protein [Bacteroidales bacterium]
MKRITLVIIVIALGSARLVFAQVQPASFSLRQLADSALQSNYLLRANEKQKVIKEADIDLLRLTYQPTISASATASVWKFLLPNKQRLLGNSLTDVYTDISVYQTIYEWGESRIRKETLEDEILLNDEIRRQLRSTIIWGVTDTYYEWLKASAEVKVHHNTLGRLGSDLEYAEALYKIGKVSGVDVLKINVQIALEEKALMKAENIMLNHKIRLGRFCFTEGAREFSIIESSDSTSPSAYLQLLFPDSLYAKTLNNHPTLKAADLKLAIEARTREMARLQNRPELFSYATGTWEHGYLPFGENFNYNIGVGIHYQIPFLGGAGYKTKMFQSDQRYEQINDEKSQLFNDLLREIDVTLNEIEDIRAEIFSTREIIKLAKITMEQASIRYQAGQGTIIDVLAAQAILSENEIINSKSSYELLQLMAKLEYLTGNDNLPY